MKNKIEKIPSVSVIQKHCENKIEKMFDDVKEDVFGIYESTIEMRRILLQDVIETTGVDSEEYKTLKKEIEVAQAKLKNVKEKNCSF